MPVGAWRARLPLLLAVLTGVVLLAAGLVAGAADRAGPGVVPVAADAGREHVARVRRPRRRTRRCSPTSSASTPATRSWSGSTGSSRPCRSWGSPPRSPPGPERTTSQCGANAALPFADQRLSGQTVTLVPDPTVPEVDDQGRRLAYVVLPSQLNYTDAALQAGVVSADTDRKLWYAPVFAREQSEAADAKRGLWGPPCRATPGRPLPAGN